MKKVSDYEMSDIESKSWISSKLYFSNTKNCVEGEVHLQRVLDGSQTRTEGKGASGSALMPSTSHEPPKTAL